MDNSQYQPPHSEHSAEIYENYKNIEQSAFFKRNPEILTAPFQVVKDIEALVSSFRDSAEAIEQANGREVKIKYLPNYLPVALTLPARPHAKIRKHLINAERTIGGQLFADKSKYYFWFGEKGTSPVQTPGVDNWYIEEIAQNNASSNIVTHIETHAKYIQKFNHAGQRVPVTLSDLDIFVPAVYHYVHAILDMYPFEKARADVILDGLVIPDNVAALLPPVPDNSSKSDYKLAA